MEKTIKDTKASLKTFLRRPSVTTAMPLIVLIIVATIINPNFMTWDNITSIMRSYVFIAMMALGLTFIFINRDIDIAIGSVMGVVGTVTAVLMVSGVPTVFAVIIGVLLGLLCGMITGFFVVFFDLPPMIGSLGMQFILRGVIFVITEGTPIYPLPDNFNAIAKVNFFGIPLALVIYIVFAVIAGFVLHKTTFGRSVYAVGGNPDTAWLCGINVKLVRMIAFWITSFLAGVAGILMTSRIASAQPNTGYGYEMYVIASVVVGGASPGGGVGSIPGTVIGSLLIGILQNVMVMVGISVYWQYIAMGAIILFAVILDHVSKDRALAAASKAKAKDVQQENTGNN